MPIYEFHCKGCNCEFETLVLRSSESVQCPQCTCEDVERLLSSFSHKSEGKYVSSAGPSCSGCSSTSCATCH